MMNEALLTQILELSRQLAETHDIDQLLSLAMEQTLDIVGAELCYLVLRHDNGELEFRAKSTATETPEEHDDLSRSIFDQVVESGEPIVIMDALNDERYHNKSSVIMLQIRSVMCVPLNSRGKTLGAIYVENRKVRGAFRKEDLQPLVFFANQAAVSIENAMIIASLEERVAARTAELESSWQEAVEANKMRTTLIGQIAHDMRNPCHRRTLIPIQPWQTQIR